jgi:large repetitive protein
LEDTLKQYCYIFGSATKAQPVTISGTTELGTTVKIFDGNTFLGDATVTGTTFSLDATLVEGKYSLTAQATNAAGNTATSTTPVTLIVDRTPPTVAINSAIDGNGNPVPDGGSTTSTSMTFAFTVTDNLTAEKQITWNKEHYM